GPPRHPGPRAVGRLNTASPRRAMSMDVNVVTPLEPNTGAVVIKFPRQRIAEPSVAELSIAALLVEAHTKLGGTSSQWARQRISSHADGLATALSITMAGECGEEQFLIKQTLVSALNDGCDDPEMLVQTARDPQGDDIA